MKGKKANLSSSACAVARSLSVIGDWWSLLIIRDALAGTRRFGEFQKKLGLAKNILATRLRKLVAEGIMQSAPASDGSAYNEYVLTEKGEALYLVIVALWQWGEAYSFAPGELKSAMVDRAKHERLAQLELRASDGRMLGPRDYTRTAGWGARAPATWPAKGGHVRSGNSPPPGLMPPRKR
jgi:DNA-binding HxlR family transcriptional regulator